MRVFEVSAGSGTVDDAVGEVDGVCPFDEFVELEAGEALCAFQIFFLPRLEQT